MKRPLVPIDGSAACGRALAHVLAELRRADGVCVHLLNVQAPLVSPWPGKLVSPDMVRDELVRQGRDVLAPHEEAVRAAGFECRRHVRIGPFADDEITGFAAEEGCDAIVMGTRGLGRVAGLVLGSVATGVVHKSGVPVTLVK